MRMLIKYKNFIFNFSLEKKLDFLKYNNRKF